MARIGHDLDGCHYGFIEGCNVIRQAQGEVLFTVGEWYFYRQLGMTDQDWVRWCNDAADNGLLFNHAPLPGSVEAMRRVKEVGHTNVVITDRSFGSSPEVSQKITHNYLDLYYPGLVDEVYFDRDKTKYNVDMMVEDKLENYDQLVNSGVDAYLIDRPWNQVEGGDARFRIKDIEEYADIVESVGARGYSDLAFV